MTNDELIMTQADKINYTLGHFRDVKITENRAAAQTKNSPVAKQMGSRIHPLRSIVFISRHSEIKCIIITQ